MEARLARMIGAGLVVAALGSGCIDLSKKGIPTPTIQYVTPSSGEPPTPRKEVSINTENPATWPLITVPRDGIVHPLNNPASQLSQRGFGIQEVYVKSDNAQTLVSILVVLDPSQDKETEVKVGLQTIKQPFIIDDNVWKSISPQNRTTGTTINSLLAVRNFYGESVSIITPFERPNDLREYAFVFQKQNGTKIQESYLMTRFKFQ